MSITHELPALVGLPCHGTAAASPGRGEAAAAAALRGAVLHALHHHGGVLAMANPAVSSPAVSRSGRASAASLVCRGHGAVAG